MPSLDSAISQHFRKVVYREPRKDELKQLLDSFQENGRRGRQCRGNAIGFDGRDATPRIGVQS